MVAQTAVCWSFFNLRFSSHGKITLLLLPLPQTGLLVSACVNRAPEGLLGAAVAEVGVHDLLKVLRFHPISIAKSNIHCPLS